MPLRGCSVALQEAEPDLGPAPARVGSLGIPGRGLHRTPAAGARPLPRHARSGLTPFRPCGQPRGPRKRVPSEQQKRRGAAGAPAPRAAASARSPAANKARPHGPCPPYLVPLGADGAEHIGSLQNAGEEDSQAQPRLAGKEQRRKRGSGERRARRSRGKAGAEWRSAATGATGTRTAVRPNPPPPRGGEEAVPGGRDRLRSATKRVRPPRPPRCLRLGLGGKRRRAPRG